LFDNTRRDALDEDDGFHALLLPHPCESLIEYNSLESSFLGLL